MASDTQDIELPFLGGVIDRFEGSFAVVKLDDGQNLNWPKKYLPAGAAAGEVVKLKLLTEIGAEAERQELAKSILNEILKGSK